jgi:hypothetical protein
MRYLITAAALSLAGSASADLNWMNDVNDYGYLWQNGLPGDSDLAQVSCVPTSWTNSLVYLQHKYAAQLGSVQIVQDGFSGWTQTALTLRSEKFMNINYPNGSSPYFELTGIEDYLISKGAGPPTTSLKSIISVPFFWPPPPDGQEMPQWYQSGNPTLNDLHGWLAAGAIVQLGIAYAGQFSDDGSPAGHALSLVGVNWTDSNGDGVVDQNENATLSVVDPDDPSQGYGDDGMQATGPTKLTVMDVWDGDDGFLQYSYIQNLGDAHQAFDPDNVATATGCVGQATAVNIVGSPLGSCCVITGCDVLTETQCSNLGGFWAVSSSCDDCPASCMGDTDGNGVVNIEDLLNMLGGWGACP